MIPARSASIRRGPAIRYILVLGLLGTLLVLLCILFKTLHWAGANLLLLFGSLLLASAMLSLVAHTIRTTRQQEARIAEMERKRLEQERLITELRIREEVGRDMHDDLGAGLSALRLRSEMAARKENDPARKAQFEALAHEAGELGTNMRQLLWSMGTEDGHLSGTVDHCLRYARSYATENDLGLSYRSEGPYPEIQLTPQQRRNLFLTIKESLHNVVKHARASEVRMSFAWKDRLLVTIKDDGMGIPNGPTTHGRGLTNMRKRIEELGGSISFTSDQGTRIRIELPLAQGIA